MRDNFTDGRTNLGGACRIVLHPVDFPADPFIERGPQLGSVRTHFVQFSIDHAQHTACDRGAKRPADQPPTLFADPFLDGST